jgi:HAD superfamily hydrolase (TIGR01509 family)
MKAVAFDAMGVLYDVADDMRQILVPFARARGTSLSDADIQRVYRRAMLGEIDTSELWAELGIASSPDALNEEYVRQYRLIPGILELLDDLRASDLRLGCISNDVADWSSARRRHLRLDSRIEHWTISSLVRSRKPSPEIFRCFLADTRLEPAEVMFVDDRPANIEGAKAVGFKTVLVDLLATSGDEAATTSVHDLRRALLNASPRSAR